MKTVFNLRKVEVSEQDKGIIDKKLTRLDKFFSADAIATITVSKTRENMNVEVTVSEKGMYFRAERTDKSVTACVDEIIDLLTRQIRKNKTRLEKRLYQGVSMNFDNEFVDEDVYDIIKHKKVYLKPMDAEEAILEMNMLGHTFFMFLDEASGKVCVVYKRKDGDYGLLESEML
ncbi:MAG: ribosome-associated translation inhibitor RaiA [Clostridia bacterium]|nr:ribosome-associated translation inhibitor RaiA [Clostridia bacterium]